MAQGDAGARWLQAIVPRVRGLPAAWAHHTVPATRAFSMHEHAVAFDIVPAPCPGTHMFGVKGEAHFAQAWKQKFKVATIEVERARARASGSAPQRACNVEAPAGGATPAQAAPARRTLSARLSHTVSRAAALLSRSRPTTAERS